MIEKQIKNAYIQTELYNIPCIYNQILSVS